MKLSNIIFGVCCLGIAGWWLYQRIDLHNREKAWEADLASRIGTDFSRTRSEVTEYIKQYIPDVTEAQIDAWTASGRLESMMLDLDDDGTPETLRYFRNAAPNLFRIDPDCYAIVAANDTTLDKPSGHNAIDAINIPSIVSGVKDNLLQGKTRPYHSAPARMRVTYTLTVDADAVPDGETVRCWLPYPRADVARQTDIRFISASEPEYVFAPESHPHSTLYMEKKAVAGMPTIFSEQFEYTAWGEWRPVDPASIRPYNTTGRGYIYYTSERQPHMAFSPRLRAIADSLTAGIDSPYLQARRIFTWVNDNFPWASAREYSTLDNIPEYVLDNGHGDCGQVTLLFLTLCRIKGIPARWQSGFMMHPGEWNLHDWGEIYFEGYGWLPVDTSFGIPPFAVRNVPYMGIWAVDEPCRWKTDLPEAEFFYFGGIDSYRLYVNSDYGYPLSPAKKYPRSETVDFQRGEVEWSGGNLYFPLWDYHMDIEYL